MPAYNCEKFVAKAIDSVLTQSYSNFELLIADDCSTDRTKDVIESYSDYRIKCYHNIQNQGYLKASNLLMEKCQGDYITFQDADDWSHPDRLQIILYTFQQASKLACVGSFVKRVDESDNIISEIRYKVNHVEIKKDLPQKFNCVGSALMIKSNVLKKVGFYNLYFDRAGSEDLYWFGLIVTNFKAINIPESLYFYRSTTNSVSNEEKKSIRKLASKDMVSEALGYYVKHGNELFNNSSRLKGAEFYVYGKHYCWNNEFRKGVSMLIKAIFLYPLRIKETINLLKIYIPKAI